MHLQNQHAAIELDPDRGGEFSGFWAGESDNLLFYADWRAPLSIDDGPAYNSTELDWLSRYNGGWQVLFPNAGAESTVGGVPVAFHGENSRSRFEVLAAADDSCVLRAYARLPLELTRKVRLLPDRPGVQVEETATNIGSRPVQFLWGHHPTFPAIAGATLDIPSATVEVEPATPGRLDVGTTQWPIALDTDGNDVDLRTLPHEDELRLLYLHDLAGSWVAMRPPAGASRLGVALSWDAETFPNLWIWLQNGDGGFPWYGRARMIGLEPQRSWPFDGAAGAIQRGQALHLEPGETRSSWITLTAFPETDRPVTRVDRDGHVHHAIS